MRYFTQGLAEIDPGRKDLLLDIATEEISHLEVVGSIVTMLNQGVKGQMAEGLEPAELLANISGGTDSHTTALLYGGGVALTNSAGVPWTAAYVDSRTEPTADMRSNIAAEARAKIIYERLINLCDDPDVKDALPYPVLSPSVSAACASRCPIARGLPSVESFRVCRSDCALMTAPRRTISAERYSQVRRMMTPPSDP
jgi:hypothetical protein